MFDERRRARYVTRKQHSTKTNRALKRSRRLSRCVNTDAPPPLRPARVHTHTRLMVLSPRALPAGLAVNKTIGRVVRAVAVVAATAVWHGAVAARGGAVCGGGSDGGPREVVRRHAGVQKKSNLKPMEKTCTHEVRLCVCVCLYMYTQRGRGTLKKDLFTKWPPTLYTRAKTLLLLFPITQKVSSILFFFFRSPLSHSPARRRRRFSLTHSSLYPVAHTASGSEGFEKFPATAAAAPTLPCRRRRTVAPLISSFPSRARRKALR